MRRDQHRLDSLISESVRLITVPPVSNKVTISDDSGYSEETEWQETKVTGVTQPVRAHNRKMTRMSQYHQKALLIESKMVRAVDKSIATDRHRQAQLDAGFDVSEFRMESQIEKHLERLTVSLRWVSDSQASKPLVGSHAEILSDVTELVKYTLEMWDTDHSLNFDVTVSFLNMVSDEVNEKVSMLHSKGVHQSHPRMFDEILMCGKLLIRAAKSVEMISDLMDN